MHILILEYVTAGGFGAAPDHPLCTEADDMVLALVRDFAALPDVTVTLPRCIQLPSPTGLPDCVTVVPGLGSMQFIDALILRHDAVLLVAPESGDILHALSARVEALGRPLLGPSAAAVAIAGDKWRCALALAEAGIAQIPTLPALAPWPERPGRWVLKPADGCGCEGIQVFPDQAAARAAQVQTAGIPGGPMLLAQPWLEGTAASLTVLGSAMGAELLSVNRQQLHIAGNGHVAVLGVDTGVLGDSDGALAALASAVHRAIPGLAGIYGIDLVLRKEGALVVEVNPRPTSAYPGLHRVLGRNPATLWLALPAFADVRKRRAQDLERPTFPIPVIEPAPAETGKDRDAGAVPGGLTATREATVLGWDLGGAHLKVAVLDRDGQLIEVVQRACALWQGLDRLEPLLHELASGWGRPALHAVTMSGEMVDLFPDRAHGVQALVDTFVHHAGGVPVSFYAGPGRWLGPSEARAQHALIASANWLALGEWAALHLPAGVVIDLGSTTCDALAFHDGQARPQALGDAARLVSGELVYTGIARTPLMALRDWVEVAGARSAIMAEWFASSADVYRVLDELPDDADLHPSADQGPKTLAGSVRRLARMVGCDGHEWPLETWQAVARQFRRTQVDRVSDALKRACARLPVADSAAPARRADDVAPGVATVVVAGAGSFLVRDACAELRLPTLDFATLGALVNTDLSEGAALAQRASRSAPAVAVAALAFLALSVRADAAAG